jgi:hypothetical protein
VLLWPAAANEILSPATAAHLKTKDEDKNKKLNLAAVRLVEKLLPEQNTNKITTSHGKVN